MCRLYSLVKVHGTISSFAYPAWNCAIYFHPAVLGNDRDSGPLKNCCMLSYLGNHSHDPLSGFDHACVSHVAMVCLFHCLWGKEAAALVVSKPFSREAVHLSGKGKPCHHVASLLQLSDSDGSKDR